ncbi:MAG: ribonuclease H family protein [Saprospiraceae bacterium]|nr:ribonuclease H family protein [Saprospiraceae bacterium]
MGCAAIINFKAIKKVGKSSKFYVVWEGRQPGIYQTWAEAKAQIDSHPGARYKSFETMGLAELAYKSGPPAFSPKTAQKSKGSTSSSLFEKAKIIANSIAVDAACSGNPGDMEYRCVETISKKEIFHQGPFPDGTNNIGEFLALVHALALLEKKERFDLVIYTDSVTAMGWVKKGKANTKLEKTKRNAPIFDLIARAEQWLKTHKVKNEILKWDTVNWGEIPADFGRK